MTHDSHRPLNDAAKSGTGWAIGHVPGQTLAVLALGVLTTPAFAYVGPGAGLGFVGTLFGIVAALVLAMIGLFWYPLKRAFGKKQAVVDGDKSEQEDDTRQ